jgi:hypothetical protein
MSCKSSRNQEIWSKFVEIRTSFRSYNYVATVQDLKQVFASSLDLGPNTRLTHRQLL